MAQDAMTYSAAGVDTESALSALQGLVGWLGKAAHNPATGTAGRPLLESGFFATVLDIGHGLGLAMATDGVGTKLLVAQMMGKYDTVGIDCVAMNVNDLICVGAEPISMLDYIAAEQADPEVFTQLGEGLYRGAEMANISIPGGEISQIKEMIRGHRDGSGFDLVGMAVGLVPADGMIIGADIADGDVVVGLASNGVHSNGYTLARRVLFDEMGIGVDTQVPELGRTVGEELLRPTAIYVKPAVEMMRSGLAVKAFSHMTSDGLLNLLRVKARTGYVLDYLPEPPPIFQLLQRGGRIADEEMFLVYNMGIGFGVVVAPGDADRVREIAAGHGFESWVLGRADASQVGRVVVEPRGLVGEDDFFRQA